MLEIHRDLQTQNRRQSQRARLGGPRTAELLRALILGAVFVTTVGCNPPLEGTTPPSVSHTSVAIGSIRCSSAQQCATTYGRCVIGGSFECSSSCRFVGGTADFSCVRSVDSPATPYDAGTSVPPATSCAYGSPPEQNGPRTCALGTTRPSGAAKFAPWLQVVSDTYGETAEYVAGEVLCQQSDGSTRLAAVSSTLAWSGSYSRSPWFVPNSSLGSLPTSGPVSIPTGSRLWHAGPAHVPLIASDVACRFVATIRIAGATARTQIGGDYYAADGSWLAEGTVSGWARPACSTFAASVTLAAATTTNDCSVSGTQASITPSSDRVDLGGSVFVQWSGLSLPVDVTVELGDGRILSACQGCPGTSSQTFTRYSDWTSPVATIRARDTAGRVRTTSLLLP